jgi:hypothetical protein
VRVEKGQRDAALFFAIFMPVFPVPCLQSCRLLARIGIQLGVVNRQDYRKGERCGRR